MSPLMDGPAAKTVLRPRLTARRLAIWASLGLICLAAVSALMLLQSIDRQIRDIADTYALRDAARELVHALSQADASQKSYVLTGDTRFLVPYESSVEAIDEKVSLLVEMTAKDAAQAGRVGSIAGHLSAKLSDMARNVAGVSDRLVNAPVGLERWSDSIRFMDDINQTLDAFIAEEDQKLAARNVAIDQTRFALIGTLIAALGAAALLAAALLSKTQKQVNVLAQRHVGLVTQNEALEAEVLQRTRDIEEARAHAERERERVEALLQDTNHRIGNSLATVSSLLALQMMRTQSTDVRNALEVARQRVHAIAAAHRRLRLGDDLESAHAEDFLSAVIEDIAGNQTDDGRVEIRGEIEPIVMAARDATTLGILAGELITNGLKHAFPDGRTGTITLALFRNADGVPVMEVRDDGVGLQGVLPENDTGLGSAIVRQLSSQFGGEPIYSASPAGGLTVTIVLKNLGTPQTVRVGEES